MISFHNYVVEQLAAINENGRFNKPKEGLSSEMAEKAWAKYDNDLFQTGRLITCGLYMNITLGDYLRTIVNLNRSNTTWTLDPRVAMGKTVLGEQTAPRGCGNQVSAEFNLVSLLHFIFLMKWRNEPCRRSGQAIGRITEFILSLAVLIDETVYQRLKDNSLVNALRNGTNATAPLGISLAFGYQCQG